MESAAFQIAEGRPANSPAPQGRLSPIQRRLFLLTLSLLAAVLVLGMAETTLRIAGYGGYPPTFRQVGTLKSGSRLIFTDNGGPSSYFFANRSLPGALDVTSLEMPKPPKTFRIMVVGESAAKGNPYPRPLGWASMLQSMLTDLRPGKQVEIINIATTAIASFPALGMLTESLEYEPDLVVVYLGNNEFYGAYGVASLHSAGRSPWMIRFVRWSRSLAIAQFIDDKLTPPPRGDPAATLMETMVGRSHIGIRDPARGAAARNLEAFVGEMIERCQRRKTPVIVCTPPANERGLAPLGQTDLSGLGAEARAELENQLGVAASLLPVDPTTAEAAARRAIEISREHATAHHLLARSLFLQGRFEASAAEFREALDLDPMPWRPPSTSVTAIRNATQRKGALLCDLESAFREASPGRSVGWELMDDHVHASLQGQYLIARTLVHTLEGLTAPVGLPPGSAERLPDLAALGERLGDNCYEHFAAAYAMRRLAKIPFFITTNPEFFERQDAVCRAIESAAPPAVQEQLRLWQDPATHRVEVRPIGGMVGYALLNSGRPAEAEATFRVAAGSVVPFGSWELEYRYMSLVCRQVANGNLDEGSRTEASMAIERGRLALSLGKSKTGAIEMFIGLLHQFRGEFVESIPLLEAARQKLTGRSRLAADEALAEAYVRTGRENLAAEMLSAGMNAGGEFADEYRRIRMRVLRRRGDPAR